MTAPQVVPYGAWKSPITAAQIAAETTGLGQIALDGDDIYWTETRSAEGGRSVVVRRTPDGQIADVTPAPFSARTRVHEYGGGAFAVADGTVYFSNFSDQRLYRQDRGRQPRPITPAGDLRYADGVIDRRRERMIWVREDHTGVANEPVNTLVSVPLDGCAPPVVLVGGNDFYSSPRLSPDGARLAWLAWNHPNMPWDGSELWVAELTAQGVTRQARRIAGGAGESIFQPEWSPGSVLHFVSDRTGWWNLSRWRGERCEPLCERAAEFGRPQWVFGQSTYAFESAARLICSYTQQGTWHLAVIAGDPPALEPLDVPYPEITAVRAAPGRVVLCAGSPAEPLSITKRDLRTQGLAVLRRSSTIRIDPGYISKPEAIAFPTANGQTAYGWFYPPANRDYVGPTGTQPPLLVMSHGGPTAAASVALNVTIQYWTSRGIAVLDVNYGGSSGYGRAYRQRLDGQWGVVDVEDCVNGARELVRRGLVDSHRLGIRGSSAGGYTTLCALTFRDVFKAGASYYGIGDLETLAKETHKFESHYDERLVGHYPKRRDLYRSRSPIHFTDRLRCPVIFFQGLEDKVVPPSQAEAMVAALRARKLPVAYVAFAGEQHGFRRAQTIKRALEAELYFYARVFGFALADPVEPVPIENL
ncbi:MAG: S9 family peptidase [Candidatus Binatia bacterium]